MKTKKALLTSLAMMLIVGLTTAAKYPTSTEKNSMPADKPADEACVQCGVTNAQITSYLQNCSHHHTVQWVKDVPSSCNSTAGTENCNIATVYVQDGNIIGHADNGYNCPN